MSWISDDEPTELKYLQSSTKFLVSNFRDGAKFTGSPRTALSSLSPPATKQVAEEAGSSAGPSMAAALLRSGGDPEIEEKVEEESEESEGEDRKPLLAAADARPSLTASDRSSPAVTTVSITTSDGGGGGGGGGDGDRDGAFRVYFHFVGFVRFLAFSLALLAGIYGHATAGRVYEYARVRTTLALCWVVLAWNLINLVTTGLTLRLHPVRGSYGDLTCSLFTGDRKTDLLPPLRCSVAGRRIVFLGAGDDEADSCRPGRLFKLHLAAADLAATLALLVSSLLTLLARGFCTECYFSRVVLVMIWCLCLLELVIVFTQPFDSFGPKWITMRVSFQDVREKERERMLRAGLPGP